MGLRRAEMESLGRELALQLLHIRQKEHAVEWIANRFPSPPPPCLQV